MITEHLSDAPAAELYSTGQAPEENGRTASRTLLSKFTSMQQSKNLYLRTNRWVSQAKTGTFREVTAGANLRRSHRLETLALTGAQFSNATFSIHPHGVLHRRNRSSCLFFVYTKSRQDDSTRGTKDRTSLVSADLRPDPRNFDGLRLAPARTQGFKSRQNSKFCLASEARYEAYIINFKKLTVHFTLFTNKILHHACQ